MSNKPKNPKNGQKSEPVEAVIDGESTVIIEDDSEAEAFAETLDAELENASEEEIPSAGSELDTALEELAESSSQPEVEPKPESELEIEDLPLTAAANPETPPPPPPVQSTSTSGGGKGLSLLALLLALLALGASGWLYWQSMQATQTTDQNASATSTRLEQITGLQEAAVGNVTTLSNELADTQSAVLKQVADQNIIINEVQELSARQELAEAALYELRGKLGNERRAWLEAELAYLLRFGNDRLQLHGDADTAIRALEEADRRIVALGDPGLFKVREQLKTDLISLRSINRPDVNGIALGLAARLDQLEQLPQREVGSHPEAYERPAPDAPVEEPVVWRQALADFWAELKTLVSVRKDETPYEVMPSIEDEFLVAQNLRLQLESARLALLQMDTELFQSTVTSAGKWLRQYYNVDDAAVTSLLDELEGWQSVDLAVELPDISGSWVVLRKQMLDRDEASVTPAPPANPAPSGDE